MDLIVNLICEKEGRISSRRYRYRDAIPESPHLGRGRHRRGYQDWTGRAVYPHDGEDIKAHKWFRDIPWDRLQQIPPPFVPQLSGCEDTHYFDEEEPISDWSESEPETSSEAEEVSLSVNPYRSPDKIAAMQAQLAAFPRHVRGVIGQFVSVPYDSAKLKRMDHEIEAMAPDTELCEALKAFVRVYGRRERKRPRDKLLRDRNTKGIVLEVRKQTAFMGYPYQRMKEYNPLAIASPDIRGDGKGKKKSNDSAELASYRAWYHARAAG